MEPRKEAAGVPDVSYPREARSCHEEASSLEAAAPLDVSFFSHRHAPEDRVLNLAMGFQSDHRAGHPMIEWRQLAADAVFDH